MLQHTFCHIPGITLLGEQRLWAAGLDCWQVIEQLPDGVVPRRRAELLRTHVGDSTQHLAAGNVHYFAERLPAREHWRLFPHFRHTIAYLDIETTGLGGPGDYVTTIALYDGQQIRHYVQGQNLDQFEQDIRCYQVIVTYNGKCFDVPFLGRAMGVHLDQVHVDLRYVLKSLGYGGGLKGCEKQLGLERGDLEGVDGFFAVVLWNEYQRTQDPKALETLLAYNIQDVVNLEHLLVLAYNLKTRSTPFAHSLQMPLPVSPMLPFQPDRPTIQRLLPSQSWALAGRW